MVNLPKKKITKYVISPLIRALLIGLLGLLGINAAQESFMIDSITRPPNAALDLELT